MATITVRIPPILRSATGGKGLLESRGSTVGQALQHTVDEHHDLRERLFMADGSLQRFVNVYVDNVDVRDVHGLDTALTEGAEVVVLTAVAGG